MEIKILQYSERLILLELFESSGFAPYGGFGNSLGATRMRKLIRDEEWWKNRNIYAVFDHGQLEAVNIIVNAQQYPWKFSSSFTRYSDAGRTTRGSMFDEYLFQVVDQSFMEEEGVIVSMEESSKDTYWNLESAYAPQHYKRATLEIFPATERVSRLGKEDLIFYRYFLDRKPKHSVGIERSIYIYYPTTGII